MNQKHNTTGDTSEVTSNETTSTYLNQPFTIKGQPVSSRFFLAPMAGLGHVAFRELVDEFGSPGLLFTGMCSAKAVPHENPEFSPVFRWRPQELSRLVCQIFGSDPDSMARAAIRIEKEGFFGVDLNFGCSVAAICKKGSGAELLKKPDLAATIVRKVREAVSIPVFVKYRTGWEDNPEAAADMARRFEDAGADALVFHPRIAPDRRSRPPKWSHITTVTNAVSIPVFGNGNLFDFSDCTAMVKQTGCFGVSVGRMAVAAPWIFASWSGSLVPGASIHYQAATRLTQLLATHYDEPYASKLFKKFIPYFAASFRFGHSIARQLIKGETLEDIRIILDDLFAAPPETLSRPNLNMFS